MFMFCVGLSPIAALYILFGFRATAMITAFFSFICLEVYFMMAEDKQGLIILNGLCILIGITLYGVLKYWDKKAMESIDEKRYAEYWEKKSRL